MSLPEYGIYVACLAAYNNGKLHGAWIDCATDIEEQYKQIAEILKTSPIPNSEEYKIHDIIGFPKMISNDLVEDYHYAAHFINIKGNAAIAAITIYGNICDAIEQLDENYIGCYNSLSHYAEWLAEQAGYLTNAEQNPLFRYINFDAFGRELEYGGDIVTHEDRDGVHVFQCQ